MTDHPAGPGAGRAAPPPCPHDLSEREDAIVDGYCPLCSVKELAELREDYTLLLDRANHMAAELAAAGRGAAADPPHA